MVSAVVVAAKSSSNNDEDENCQDSVMGYNFQGNQVGRRVGSLISSREKKNVKNDDARTEIERGTLECV